MLQSASICLFSQEKIRVPPNLRNFLTGICSILFSSRIFKNFRLRGSHFGNFEFLENSSRKFPHHLPPLRKFRLNEINEIKLKIVQLLLSKKFKSVYMYEPALMQRENIHLLKINPSSHCMLNENGPCKRSRCSTTSIVREWLIAWQLSIW